MKKIAITILFLILFGCAKSKVGEREEYWLESVNSFLVTAQSIQSLTAWLDNQGVESVLESDDGYHSVVLERIQDDGPACSEWLITLYFETDGSGGIRGQEIDSLGICL